MNEELSQEKIEEEITGKQSNNRPLNNRPWLFQPGQSGNPSGRPKGSKSLKTFVQEMLRDMSDEEKVIYLKGMSKDKIWEMGEGKPKQDSELDINVRAKIISIDE